MAVLNRSTLPQEFFDITSAELLIAPEPQYLHAQLAMASIAADLELNGAKFGLAGREAPANGADYIGIDQMKLMLSDPIGGSAIRANVDIGKGPGQVVKLNRPSFANSTYTLASREINASSSISTSPLAVSSEQVALVLKRYAGPYDSDNTRVAPYAIDSFDAQFSVHRMASIVGMHMRRDYHRWLDSVMVALFDTAANTVYVGTAAADTDYKSAGDNPLDADTLFRVEETLGSNNIPQFANGRWACVLHPRQLRQLKTDSQFGRYAEDHKEVNPLFKSYVSTLSSLDIFVSNTLDTDASTTTIYKGQAFGPGAVGLGVGKMPMVASSTDDNYGMQQKVIWTADLAPAVLDNRFLVSIHSN